MLRLLVLGTGNRKKGQELAGLLAHVGVELRTLADYPQAIDVVEDGDTFAANAALKATQQARHLGQWVLADDSGLTVDALDGAPGVISARYSGPGATDAGNNQKLLDALRDVPLASARPSSSVISALPTPAARSAAKVRPPAAAGFFPPPAAEAVSATIRSSRSWNTIAVSAS